MAQLFRVLVCALSMTFGAVIVGCGGGETHAPGTDAAIDTTLDSSLDMADLGSVDGAMPFDGSMMMDDGGPVTCVGDGDCIADACMVAHCVDSVCFTAPRDCADTDPCTIDTCDPGMDACHYAAVDEGTSCGTGGELCCGGACLDTTASVTNCGGCGIACGANADCVSSSCTCLAGFDDCDGAPGCEASVLSDSAHCGTCTTVCSAPTPSCIGGSCGSCTVDTDCADDGLDCTAAPVCSSGTCVQPLIEGNCLIAGGCYVADMADPSNVCLICDPPQNTSAWSADVGAPCDDGRFCTTPDVCSAGGVCGGAMRSCTDGLACTGDACDEVGDACVSTPLGTACVIGGACIATGTVNPLNACQVCDASVDAAGWTPQTGYTCDDGLFCTVADSCDSMGACVGSPRGCADTVSCTTDTCNDVTNACQHVVAADSCQIAGACYATGTINVANPCQACDPLTATNAWTARTSQSCDDGQFCTVNDQCTASATCVGTAKVCDDSVSCTVDSCNEATDTCEAAPASDKCLIASVCYDAATVDPLNSCRACTPATSRTAWTPRTSVACDDGLYCTINDACTASSTCVGTTRDCSDAAACTTDSCNEVTDVCDHPLTSGNCSIASACYAAGAANATNGCQWCDPATSTTAWSAHNAIACDDGFYCTTGDMCSGGTCTGATRSCDDAVSCTSDSCNESADRCDNTATGSNCTIGGQCFAAGASNPVNGCMVCNPSQSATAWTALATGAGCNDGLFCTVSDQCNSSGVCVGTAKVCSDGIGCTTDSCNEGTDTCDSTPSPGNCAIGGACYSAGGVNPANGCQICDPSISSAAWTARTGLSCDDGLYCTTTDTCTAGSLCVGTPRVCNDALSCTVDSCDDDVNACVYQVTGTSCAIGGACITAGTVNPLNGCQACDPGTSTTAWSPRTGLACNDGAYCTTGETCTAGAVCTGGSPTCNDSLACTGDSCNEATDTCTNTPLGGSCVIGGACFTSGALNGQCQVCTPALSQTAWTPRTGTACDDANFCTAGDVCRSDASCLGAGVTCDDGLGCTTDTCNAGAGTCGHAVAAGSCSIAGACYANGTVNTSNPCQWCASATSQTAWTAHTGFACDDGQYCTTTDLCTGGGTCTGTPRNCADAYSCTTDTCNDVADRCDNTVSPGACLIAGTCWADGNTQTGVGATCNQCRSALSQTEWSVANGGTVCRAATLPCDVQETCSGASTVCPSDGYAVSSVVCRPAASGHLCDATESCTGIGSACPTDGFLSGVECRPATGDCDASESCTGSSLDCPPNLMRPATDICRPRDTGLYGPCDEAEYCDSFGNTCPPNTGYETTDARPECRASTGTCDPAESCDGLDVVPPFDCPANAFSPTGAGCTDGNATTCESCNGTGSCGVTGTCGDALACTSDACSGTNSCPYSILPGFCLIAGVCYAAGTYQPTNACRACLPGTSTTAWSNVDDNSSCGGASFCCAGVCGFHNANHCATCGDICPSCGPSIPRMCTNDPDLGYLCDCPP